MSDYNPSNPDEIRATIERTREELSGDVDALADKVTPSKVVDREKDKIRGRVETVKDRVFGAASDAKQSVSDAGSSLVDGPKRAAARAEGNPFAVGLIAFGVGLLAASLIPASDKEKELATQAKDAVQPVLQDAAREVADHLKEPAQEAAQAVKETAQDAAGTVKSAAADEKASVQDSVARAQDEVRDQGTP